MAYDAPNQYRELGHVAHQAAQVTGIALARVVAIDGDRAQLRIGGQESWAAIDPSVDPALVEQARERGARVVVETGAQPTLVGVLMTARAAEIDRDGAFELRVKTFSVYAEEALLQTPRAFLRLRRQFGEIFADELVARGRLLTRILGKAIKLN